MCARSCSIGVFCTQFYAFISVRFTHYHALPLLTLPRLCDKPSVGKVHLRLVLAAVGQQLDSRHFILHDICVCVWNIWTDVKLLLRISTAGGTGVTLVPVPTKTASCHSDIKGRRPFDVPAPFHFSEQSHSDRLSSEPDKDIIWMAIYALQSISECWTLDALFQSGLYSTFLTYILGIPMITSKRTPWYLGLVWFCMHGIQFPTDPMMDQFLSSVCVFPLNQTWGGRREDGDFRCTFSDFDVMDLWWIFSQSSSWL